MKTEKTTENYAYHFFLSSLKEIFHKGDRAPVSYAKALTFPTLLDIYFNWVEQEDIVENTVVVITKDHSSSEHLYRELSLFSNDKSPVHFFPHLEGVPYQREIPVPKHLFYRAKVINFLLNNKKQIIITNVKAVTSYMTPIERSPFFSLKKGKPSSIKSLKSYLLSLQYKEVDKVLDIGEFSFRGSIFDVYSAYEESPARINFFDEEVESIFSFNPASQISEKSLEECLIAPFNYDVPNEEDQKVLIENLTGEEKRFFQDEMEKVGHLFDFQNYIPLFFKEKATLLDIFQNDLKQIYFLDPKSLRHGFESLEKTFSHYKTQSNLLFNVDFNLYHKGWEEFQKEYAAYTIEPLSSNNEKSEALSYKSLSLSRSGLEEVILEIKNKLNDGYVVVLSADYGEQIKRLSRLFLEMSPIVLEKNSKKSDELDEQIGKRNRFFIVQSFISDGFFSEEEKILWISERELFGRKKNRKTSNDSSSEIDHFLDLKENDYVVHINYGIGLYLGIERIDDKKRSKDFLKIQYANKSILYIPIEQINFVQKYIGKKDKLALDDLNSKAWEKVKRRVKKEVEGIAKDLIELYSKRQSIKKAPFSPYNPFQIQFESDFPYEETEDQLKAFEEIQNDMEKPIPMDRLLCGDVGFGKTEVAMRAAFKAVMDRKQVVLMAPTTILSEQHYQTFSERFKNYAVRVEVLNRFKTPKEVKAILNDLLTGKIEILIGTHRVISDDVKFKQLGLLIIDEEQKFGVKHKEKIRKLFSEVDTLSLSATPIPRTLHMSLLEIRALSLLKTPPSSRLPVETFVLEFDETVLKKAILDEMKRNGQVFFLHNRISDIYDVANYIRNLVGENVSIAVAHGQMQDELEDVMLQFISGAHDVLVSTSIIDSGIDIPNTNTIIVNNAQYFGLSQLYQLRGRVGRAEKQGYAYLFYSRDKTMNEEAMKRLQSILDYTELGSGFEIAMRDIEIRGVGNILGESQSGNVSLVGYEMYCKLLEEAVSEIKEDQRDLTEVYLDIKYDGFIPDAFIPDTKEKVKVYKQIHSFNDLDDLQRFVYELYDRFGAPPEEVKNFIEIAKIRILCKFCHVASIVEKGKKITWTFLKKENLKMEVLTRKIQEHEIYIEKEDAFYVLWDHLKDSKEKFERIIKLMDEVFRHD